MKSLHIGLRETCACSCVVMFCSLWKSEAIFKAETWKSRRNKHLNNSERAPFIYLLFGIWFPAPTPRIMCAGPALRVSVSTLELNMSFYQRAVYVLRCALRWVIPALIRECAYQQVWLSPCGLTCGCSLRGDHRAVQWQVSNLFGPQLPQHTQQICGQRSQGCRSGVCGVKSSMGNQISHRPSG